MPLSMFANQQTEKRIDKFSYSPLAVIGRGSFSTVFRGKVTKTLSPVAIKVINKKVITDSLIYRNVKHELQLLPTLQHPNVITCLAVLQTENNIYLVTEFCPEGTLAGIIAKRKIGCEEAAGITKGICSALGYLLARGLLHRDIKPDNILIKEGVPKLIDFGFSCELPLGENSTLSQCLGSPLYMSPQMLRGQPYSAKNDVWSFGICLFQLLYGGTPWPAQSKGELLWRIQHQPAMFYNKGPGISEQLARLAMSCLQVSQSQRLSYSGLVESGQRLLKEQEKSEISTEKSAEQGDEQPMRLKTITSYTAI